MVNVISRWVRAMKIIRHLPFYQLTMIWCLSFVIHVPTSILRLRLHFGGHRVYFSEFINGPRKLWISFICVLCCSAWKILHFGTILSFIGEPYDDFKAVKNLIRRLELVHMRLVFGPKHIFKRPGGSWKCFKVVLLLKTQLLVPGWSLKAFPIKSYHAPRLRAALGTFDVWLKKILFWR